MHLLACSYLETFLELLDLCRSQLLGKPQRPNWHNVAAGFADVCLQLWVVRVVEDWVTVRPDDRHSGWHGTVARKLRLARHRRVTCR